MAYIEHVCMYVFMYVIKSSYLILSSVNTWIRQDQYVVIKLDKTSKSDFLFTTSLIAYTYTCRCYCLVRIRNEEAVGVYHVEELLYGTLSGYLFGPGSIS